MTTSISSKRVFAPQFQHTCAETAKEVKASHLVYISHLDAVARVIRDNEWDSSNQWQPSKRVSSRAFHPCMAREDVLQ
jgi:hypothetical protein